MSTFDSFARYYDADYRCYDDDIGLIMELAGQTAAPCLELGCGTGRVLLPLATAGYRITGVDISPALLAVAREKLAAADLASRVRLLEDDVRTVSAGTGAFDLVFCTSNTLMHVTTAADQQRVLDNAYRHLAPGGLFMIDLFNPDPMRLTQINGVQELADRWEDPASGAQVLKWSVRTIDWAEQIQETLFIYEEMGRDGRVQRTVCPFDLRFLWRHEAELMLERAGFDAVEAWGDFDGGPYDVYAERLILLAERTA